ncbi:hypothetical protein PRZ48_002464 [Zasmidium cellare]|uniref:Uncharacterized protein n=1 Tax=Zasmidium cellare TaxID=395010 RepID=A0ABR0F6C1_ZASCE|nr:hypothetical protein PRZ48_002464 [Zasmidium cellare]
MARFKQTDPRSQRRRVTSDHAAHASTAGLIIPSDNSDDEAHMKPTPTTALPTPRASATTQTPTTANPPTTASGKPLDYLTAKHYDRQALKIHITAAIQKNLAKFQTWTARERWAFVQQERFRKLRERERGERRAGGSARGMFPGQYEEGKEVDWLWSLVRRRVGGGDGVRWEGVVGEVGSEDGERGLVEGKMSGKMGKRDLPRVDYNEDSDDEDDEEVRLPMKAEPEREDEDGDVDMADVQTSDSKPTDLPVLAHEQLDDTPTEPRRMWRTVHGTMTVFPPSEDQQEVELEASLAKEAMRRVASMSLISSGYHLQAEQWKGVPRHECVAQ